MNRWLLRFGVRHDYLQVFFDKTYVIPFKDILTICSDPQKQGKAESAWRPGHRAATEQVHV
ncbi:MAG: AccI family restriction endonuclease [Puniceicoccaceae bacterium]|nr:AccI family restriction endonuclease [Puniceicoccaceae bacterium]MBL6837574.1 AccI family restriction endonuclease [Puniceicoccaceae bacterium]MBL6913243.1 AccI family restriction endonuclease [Puniceicoccaceae bacterium]